MSNPGQDEEGFISKNRLETLVDSVFAFAMTLLVVSLAIPTIPDSQAAAALPVYIAGMYSEFVSFLLAFLLLAIFWIVHHRNFHYLHSIDIDLAITSMVKNLFFFHYDPQMADLEILKALPGLD